MDFPLGSETINDYIKEYLSFNDFKNTYDCFTAELQAKTVSTKLINIKPIEDKPNAPRIYNFLKSDQDKTGKENALEANLFSLHDNYRKVVLAARNILSISIGMVDFLETHNENLKTITGFEETIEKFKLNLTRFHSILLVGDQKMIIKKPLLHQDLTKLKEEIYVKPSNNKRIIEIILEIRLSLLKGDMDNRKTLIKWLIEVDFLKVKENEDFETIIDLISLNDHSLTTCLISLISMICSSLDGVYYVTSSFQKNSIIKKIFLIMKQEKTSTTLKRFSLSLLEKFSVYPELISILLQNEVLSWAIIVLSSFDNEEFDIFMINYTTALFLNFLLHLTGGKIDEANLKEIVPGGAEFIINMIFKLVMVEKLGRLAIYNLILCLSCFFKQKHLADLENTNFMIKIRDFLKSLKNRSHISEQEKKALEDFASKSFTLGPQEENLELLLSQKIEYRKEISQMELKKNNHDIIMFEVFSDEVY